MQLVQRGLRGRAFALQFQEIMSEFGDEIPWLAPIHPIRYATNVTYFERELVKRLGGEHRDDIDVFQFVTSHRSREFFGGMVRFAHCPERFETEENRRIMERLVANGYTYISCLQVRDGHRGQGHGSELFRRALGAVLEKHGKVWGVVSDPRVLRWHISLDLGAEIHTSHENAEHLWLLSWG